MTKNCKYCSAVFKITNRPTKIYCSGKCQKRASSSRNCNYEKNKKYSLYYFKTSEKYKDYKKKYDKKYLNKNKCYASFRATKSTLYKKYGKELGNVLLLKWAINKANKMPLCEKTKNKIEELMLV